MVATDGSRPVRAIVEGPGEWRLNDLAGNAVLTVNRVTGAVTLVSPTFTAPSVASLIFAGAGRFALGTPEDVTIAGGVATATRPYVNLIGEGATTDTLDSIVKGDTAAGDLLLISCSGAYTITFDNSATLLLGAGTRAMAQGSSMLLLATSATIWKEISFTTAAS